MLILKTFYLNTWSKSASLLFEKLQKIKLTSYKLKLIALKFET